MITSSHSNGVVQIPAPLRHQQAVCLCREGHNSIRRRQCARALSMRQRNTDGCCYFPPITVLTLNNIVPMPVNTVPIINRMLLVDIAVAGRFDALLIYRTCFMWVISCFRVCCFDSAFSRKRRHPLQYNHYNNLSRAAQPSKSRRAGKRYPTRSLS